MSMSPEPRPVQKDDLFRLRFIQGAALSPDDATVAYVVSKTNADKDNETSAIYLMSLATGQTRQLTAGTSCDSNPHWSPDGKTLAFMSTRGGTPQVYVIRPGGGEARQLTSAKLGVRGGPAWSPDGTQIAYTTVASDQARDPSKPYRVTRSIYRLDGVGYIQDAVQDIYVIPVAGGEARRLTTGDILKQLQAWSPDDKAILYVASLAPDTQELRMGLRTVDFEGVERDITGDWGSATGAAWTPDGGRIVFVGEPEGKTIGSKQDLWVVGRDGGLPECRTTGLRAGVGGICQPDMPVMSLRGAPFVVSGDGRWAFARVQEGGTVGVYRVALSGPESCEKVVSGDRCAVLTDAGERHLLYVMSDFDLPTDLYISDLDGANERRLTQLNDDVLSGLLPPRAERLLFPSAEGARVEAFILLPAVGQAPYPTLVFIHGGPHSANGHIYSFDSQMLCGAGFAVLMVNYRGSSGYGDEFGTGLYGALGNLDYQDLMAGVDHAIARGLADPDRLGVFGISQGGFLSSFIVGQTDRFKAAVPEAPVTDWRTYYGTTDIGPWYIGRSLGGAPQEMPEQYARSSPI